MAVRGVDTASVAGNGSIDWAAFQSSGGTFAIIRAAWGTSPDSAFHKYWPGLSAMSLVRGAYLFWRVTKDAAAQAKVFINTVGSLGPGTFPPVIDVEFSKGLAATGFTAPQALSRLRIAWDALATHYGTAPLIYTSQRVWRDDLKNLPAGAMLESPLWLARYFNKTPPPAPPVPIPWGDADNWWIHQYRGDVDAKTVPGFTKGDVDFNRFNYMRPGAVGERVRWLQRKLGVAQTATYDQATEAAVRQIQSSASVSVDGIVGPVTFAQLCWK